jgi:hypothetical protein
MLDHDLLHTFRNVLAHAIASPLLPDVILKGLLTFNLDPGARAASLSISIPSTVSSALQANLIRRMTCAAIQFAARIPCPARIALFPSDTNEPLGSMVSDG